MLTFFALFFALETANSQLIDKPSDFFTRNILLQVATEAPPHSVYNESYPEVVVSTSKGKLRGFQYDTKQRNRALMFQGVPFAEAPVGELRFAKPAEKKPWEDILDTFYYAPGCIQRNNSDNILIYGTTSEDCLYLNIYAPSDALDGKKQYPVVYYTYGGAFDFGSPAIFDPTFIVDSFVSQGIIFITTNYRVGGLAFFSTGTKDAPGNLQMHDVIQGLRWTNDEIHNFGGDKSRITVMGHSSGAMNTVYLTLTPLTEGLYNQALIMSGPGLNPRMLHNDLSWYKNVADSVGCGSGWSQNSGQVIDCMRSTDAQFISDSYDNLHDSVQSSAYRIDGEIFPESLEALAAKRRPTKYLVGTASNETPWGLRSFPAPRKAAIERHCKSAATSLKHDEIVEPCVYFYDVEQRGRDTKYFDFMNQRVRLLDTDYSYFAPVFKDADYMRRAGGDVFLYNFEYAKQGTEQFAVFHAMDLYYIFGFPDLGAFTGGRNAEDERIGKLYSTLFGNFIKTGDPTPTQPDDSSAGKWEPLREPMGFNYYKIDRNSSSEEFYHFDAVQFWNEVVPYVEN